MTKKKTTEKKTAKTVKKSGSYRPGGKPFRLSASAITEFECPYKGYLSYIERRRPKYPDTINTVFGSSFHETIEMALKYNRIDPLFIERGFFTQFDRNIAEARMPPADLRRVGQFRSMIPDVTNNAIDLCQSADLMRPPVEIEKKHILTYKGWQVAIIIDLLMKDGDGYHVFDWKTGRAINWEEGRELTVADMDGHIQLTLYHLAVQKMFGEPPASLNLLYPRDTVRLRLASRGKAHIATLSKKMDDVVKCVQKFEKTKDKGLFPTRPDPAACRFCDHKDICSDVHPDALKPPKKPTTMKFGAGAGQKRWKRRKKGDLGEALKIGLPIRTAKKEV